MELANRSQLEQDFARQMGKLSAAHRRELLALMGNPPDARRVPAEFWERCEREDRDKLILLLLLIFLVAAEQHAQEDGGADLDQDAALRSTLQTQAAIWAATQAADVAAGMAETSRNRIEQAEREWRESRIEAAERQRREMEAENERAAETTGEPEAEPDYPEPPHEPEFTPEEIETAAEEAAAEAVGLEEAVDVANEIFGPNRIESIAVTETTNAASAGGDAGIAETVGISADDLWIAERDNKTCKICLSLDRKPRSEWSPYYPSGPPAHVRCRCYVQHANTVQQVPAATH